MVAEADKVALALLGSEQAPTRIFPLLDGFYHPNYPAGAVNLIDGLKRLIQRSTDWDISILPAPLSDQVGDILDDLEDVVSHLMFDLRIVALPFGEGSGDSNPFAADKGIQLAHHAFAALVCDLDINPELGFLYDQVRVLYLGYAWSSGDSIADKKKIALELRKFAVLSERSRWRRQYLGLGEDLGGQVQLDRLVSALSGIFPPDEGPSSYKTIWYQALNRLQKYWVGRLSGAGSIPVSGESSNPPKSQRGQSGANPRPVPVSNTPRGKNPSPGEGSRRSNPFKGAHGISVPVEFGQRHPGEAPQRLPALELDIEDAPDALAVFLGASRFWLQAVYSLTSVSPGVLDGEERGALCELFDLPSDHGAREDYEARLVLEISYDIGITVDKVLEVSVGPTGIIDSNGCYRREIRQPDQSFIPDEGEMHRFRDLLEVFSLPLPERIRSRLALIMPLRGCKRLIDCLETPAELLVPAIARQLEIPNSTYGLEVTLEDISLSLRNSVYLTTKNPALTLHIAGLDGYAPPSMSWYQGVNEAKLCATYELAMEMLYSHD